ncbi:GNAT family N-acetyltransferase [Sphingobacterium suaedae]|uniref:GNAT family N-acetyltransferase n=1 Tax=Sphingobacterium suaedae TaxID=1686402 RepID=A0ABW5KQ38_9SPHI
MDYILRKAVTSDLSIIWEIVQQAIQRRKEEGSKQWQDGYPNPSVIEDDINRGVAFVYQNDTDVVGYCAILQNDEPAYANIEGAWLTHGDFLVIHRVAISGNYLGKGLAKRMLEAVEELARERGVPSIKADTNFDNPAMMHVFEKLGYQYCGEVMLRGGTRRAYEKAIV